ncbi:hypothetical protein ECEC96038_4638, partial [Escherichia coli EC96038]
MARQVVALEQR